MRVRGWEQRLAKLMWQYQTTEFDWKHHNCVTAAGHIANAIDQEGHILQHMDKLSDDEDQCYAYVNGLGYDTLEELVADHYPRGSFMSIRRGDIVVIDDPRSGGQLLGNYNAGEVYAVTQKGFAKFRLRPDMPIFEVR